ncbi:hypothetical protein ALC57_03960, partial [Trachymyrmex cornetzi]
IPAFDLLQWNAVQFIMNVRENCKVSQTAIDQIIDGITPPTKISLDTGIKWKKRKSSINIVPEIIDVTYDAYIVLFLDNLKNLLYDDLGITNPLGGSSKIHKMSMFYWGALDKMMEPFMSDIKKLKSEGVITINVRGKIKNFKGSLLFCACDTPAAALLGGFKESSAAYRLCRTCMVTNIIIEVPLEIMIRSFLRYCIIEENLFTINDFNNSVATFDFQRLKKDKSGFIQREHLIGNDCLRQKAGQIFFLAHTLLFLINEWISNCNAEGIIQHTHCFVLLSQILNITLAYQIHEDSITLLNRIMETFLLNFKSLNPNLLVPKFLFLIHIPHYIRMFGPARQSWCFRFKACHSYFKSLVPVVRNFKNMALTLSYRHQSRLCTKLAVYFGMPSKKFLYKGDHVTLGEMVLVSNLPYAIIFRGIINESEGFTYELMHSPKIVIHGTTYCPKKMLLKCNENELPQFGEIYEIYVRGDCKLFIIKILQTESFEWRYNVYCVTETHEKCI